ncbi:biotin/lipoate--protein ligase family protein [uncultured Roseibium sp.]|uniref:biotin/lipoate--protein ligase family protein n=1 Tax=uncultured Roseibium sp. TaxID=1936171 RepID=UPI00259893CF|nr:biotin/lipoate--protein ligase family protein [uncultured Roseibium sp.]
MNEPLNFNPSLPPLLSGHPVLPPLDPFEAAVSAAGSGEGEAGDLFWSCATETIAFAIVLEPDVERSRVQEMLFVLMVSAADALGAICPPEMGISWNWPTAINANRASLGMARMVVSEGDDENGAPDWMVVGLELGLKPTSDAEPGEDLAATTLWDEGGVDVEAVPALESLARHFLTWVHRWESDGFKPVHEAWLFRCDGYRKTVSLLEGETPVTGNFMGLDNHGNLLLKVGDDARVFAALDHLSPATCALPVVGQDDKPEV